MFYYDTRECELLHLQHSDDKVCVLIQISFHWKISFCWVLSRLYLIVSLNSKLQSLHQSSSRLQHTNQGGTIQTKYKSKYQTQIYNIHWISKQSEIFVCALKARVVLYLLWRQQFIHKWFECSLRLETPNFKYWKHGNFFIDFFTVGWQICGHFWCYLNFLHLTPYLNDKAR